MKAHGPFYKVIEIGSRDINGGVRDLFSHAVYIGVDVAPGPGVDRVADGATWEPMGDVDCVVCCETLEHAANAREIVRNCVKMLDKGGTLIITAAGPGRDPHSAIDLDPIRDTEYYRNIDPDDLRGWIDLPDCEVVDASTRGYTDVYAVAVK